MGVTLLVIEYIYNRKYGGSWQCYIECVFPIILMYVCMFVLILKYICMYVYFHTVLCKYVLSHPGIYIFCSFQTSLCISPIRLQYVCKFPPYWCKHGLSHTVIYIFLSHVSVHIYVPCLYLCSQSYYFMLWSISYCLMSVCSQPYCCI